MSHKALLYLEETAVWKCSSMGIRGGNVQKTIAFCSHVHNHV